MERLYAKRVRHCLECPHLAFREHERNSYCYANGTCTNVDNETVKMYKIPAICPLPKRKDFQFIDGMVL